jgi:predicted SAM-dependent methyltransferase
MKRLLHLGCGPIRIQSHGQVSWINADKEQNDSVERPASLTMDCLEVADHFGENYADGIFTCHMIEHLDYPKETVRFFEQAFKVLKPGGVLRVVVPDLTLIARAYTAGSDLKFIYGTEGKWFYHKENSTAERFHFFMHAWEHRMVFNKPLLRELMTDAGFSDARKMPFGVSDVPEMCGIDRFQSESLCMEAVK